MGLFNELKRRNVFRVAAAYLVISWLLVQVLGLAASSFEAPIWVMKMIITLLAIGFIPTILFSWAYELTPEGLKKDSDVDLWNQLPAQKTFRQDPRFPLLLGRFGIPQVWQKLGWPEVCQPKAGTDGSNGQFQCH